MGRGDPVQTPYLVTTTRPSMFIFLYICIYSIDVGGTFDVGPIAGGLAAFIIAVIIFVVILIIIVFLR